MRAYGRTRLRTDSAPLENLSTRPRLESAELNLGGLSIAICGGGLLISAAVDLTGSGQDAPALGAVGAAALLLGLVIRSRVRLPEHVSPRTSLRTVGVSLLAMITVSVVAYRATGAIVRPGEALMESTSGFTTTAVTVLDDPQRLGSGVLFWRAMTQWIGGFAALATVIAILPFLGVSGPTASKVRVPVRRSQMSAPRMNRLLGRYVFLYLFLTIVGVLLYLVGGMGPFDAITYSFTTISTGGFANHSGSFTFFDSPLLEWMGVAGMFLGGLSLAVVWSALRGRTRALLGTAELFVYCGLIVGATAVLAMVESPGADFASNVRISAFTATSAVSSTGHWVANWAAWAPGPQMMLLILIGVGAMSGSVGGGFRIVRAMTLFSFLARELDVQLRPGLVQVVRVGDEVIDDRLMRRILGYQVLYLGTAAAGFFALAVTGTDLLTALSGSVSALSTFGPALGELGVGQPVSNLGRGALVILMVLMFAGRVELYPLLDGIRAAIGWPMRRIRSWWAARGTGLRSSR